MSVEPCDRETAAFSISQILWRYHQFETLLQGSIRYWNATDLLHVAAVRTAAFNSHSRFCRAAGWKNIYIYFLQNLCTLFCDSSKFLVDLLTKKWTVNLSSWCVVLKYVTLWITYISFYQIKGCTSLQQRITKPYSEPMSSTSKIM